MNAAPDEVSTVVKPLPSWLTWMLNSRVSDSSSSPPALACFTTKRFTGRTVPRSTWRNNGQSSEHHLSWTPPAVLPLTAFSGPSSGLQGRLPVTGWPAARFCRPSGP